MIIRRRNSRVKHDDAAAARRVITVDFSARARYRALPKAMRAERAWVLWRHEPYPHKPGKFIKIPYCTDGGRRRGVNGSPEDRRRLARFETVIHRRGYDGIGIALLDGGPFWALDLDDCIDASGRLTQLAERVVASGTYVERSPSGRGLHALYAGKIGIDAKNHEAGVETFHAKWWITVTGDRVGDSAQIVECPVELLREIIVVVGSKVTRRHATPGDTPPENRALLADIDLPRSLWREILDEPYPRGCDRSGRLFSIALRLKRLRLTREQVLEIVALDSMIAPALDRRGSVRSAREWLWRYVVCPAFEQQGVRR